MDNDIKKEVVLILGLMGSGKSYMSRPFIKDGYTKISFADPLRKMCYKILGFDPSDKFTYDEFKKSKLVLKKGLFKTKNINTGRKVLQQIGSSVKELFCPTIWADVWYNSVLECNKHVVNEDCRFDYEVLKALSLTRKKCNVRFIWSCYNGNDYTNALNDTHESEALAQFIYKYQDKYNLYDGKEIPVKLMKQILKDFKEFTK